MLQCLFYSCSVIARCCSAFFTVVVPLRGVVGGKCYCCSAFFTVAVPLCGVAVPLRGVTVRLLGVAVPFLQLQCHYALLQCHCAELLNHNVTVAVPFLQLQSDCALLQCLFYSCSAIVCGYYVIPRLFFMPHLTISLKLNPGVVS